MKTKHTVPKRGPLDFWALAAMESNLRELKQMDGIDRGYFFDTSGNLRLELVNPTRRYSYVRSTIE